MDDPQALSIGAFAQALITHDLANAIKLLDQALEMAANIPAARHGSIEVRPIMKFS